MTSVAASDFVDLLFEVVVAVTDEAARGLRVFFSFTSVAVALSCVVVVAGSLFLRGFRTAGVVDEDLFLACETVAELDLSPPSFLIAS